jgi:hypothetical protein
MTNIHFLFKEQGIDKLVNKDVGCDTCSGCSPWPRHQGTGYMTIFVGKGKPKDYEKTFL